MDTQSSLKERQTLQLMILLKFPLTSTIKHRYRHQIRHRLRHQVPQYIELNAQLQTEQGLLLVLTPCLMWKQSVDLVGEIYSPNNKGDVRPL